MRECNELLEWVGPRYPNMLVPIVLEVDPMWVRPIFKVPEHLASDFFEGLSIGATELDRHIIFIITKAYTVTASSGHGTERDKWAGKINGGH